MIAGVSAEPEYFGQVIVTGERCAAGIKEARRDEKGQEGETLATGTEVLHRVHWVRTESRTTDHTTHCAKAQMLVRKGF